MTLGQIEAFWRSYVDTLPLDSPVRDKNYVVERFSNFSELIDELGALIVGGIKTDNVSRSERKRTSE